MRECKLILSPARMCTSAAGIKQKRRCPSKWSLQASNWSLWKFTAIIHPCDIEKKSSISNEKHSEDVELAQTSCPRDELRDKSALVGRESQMTLIKSFWEASVVRSTPCSAVNSASFKWTRQLKYCSMIQDRTVAHTLPQHIYFEKGKKCLLF